MWCNNNLYSRATISFIHQSINVICWAFLLTFRRRWLSLSAFISYLSFVFLLPRITIIFFTSLPLRSFRIPFLISHFSYFDQLLTRLCQIVQAIVTQPLHRSTCFPFSAILKVHSATFVSSRRGMSLSIVWVVTAYVRQVVLRLGGGAERTTVFLLKYTKKIN